MRLELGNIPMRGKSGKRDNVEILVQIIAMLVPSGKLVILEVGHNEGCPCELDDLPIQGCTCENVDLTLDTIEKERVQ